MCFILALVAMHGRRVLVCFILALVMYGGHLGVLYFSFGYVRWICWCALFVFQKKVSVKD